MCPRRVRQQIDVPDVFLCCFCLPSPRGGQGTVRFFGSFRPESGGGKPMFYPRCCLIHTVNTTVVRVILHVPWRVRHCSCPSPRTVQIIQDIFVLRRICARRGPGGRDCSGHDTFLSIVVCNLGPQTPSGQNCCAILYLFIT